MKIKLIIICCSVLSSLTGCSKNPWSIDQVKSITYYGDGYIRTVEHDKHLFIVENSHQISSFIHHPDCPCKKP